VNGSAGLKVPVNDLRRHWQSTQSVVQPAVERVLASGRYVLGDEVAGFEAAFAAYCGASHCIGVGNGTDALELALRALDVGPGDEVATVANAGMYASAAILAIGARPRFVDVELESLNMDPAALAAVLGGGIRAVIVTHLYGRLADMERLLPVAAAHDLPVIEDCAQAHGACRDGRMAGRWGTVGCYSFYPTKNLGALGDGGALVTDAAVLAERIAALRQYGWGEKYRAGLPGGRNSRLDELQAAVLAAKLPLLDDWNQRRRSLAGRYREALSASSLQLPPAPDRADAVHLYVVRSAVRNQLRAALARRGIATEIHYPIPDHRQHAVLQSTNAEADLPVTEQAAREVLTLPCFTDMTETELDAVVGAVEESLSEIGDRRE